MEVRKNDDFSLWYQQVLTRSEMLDYYDISGCYILRPWSFNIWKEIQSMSLELNCEYQTDEKSSLF